MILEEEAPQAESLSKPEKEKVFEKFRQERLKLLADFVLKLGRNEQFKRLISGAVNATVGSYVKLSIEAFRGETIEGKDLKGQKLTPYGRAMDAIIVASGLGSYLAVALGRPDIASATYATSWATWLLMYGADTLGPILDGAAKKSEEKKLGVHPFLRGCSNLLSKSKNIFIEKNADPKQN